MELQSTRAHLVTGQNLVRRYFVGVDPGSFGAVAFYTPENGTQKAELQVVDLRQPDSDARSNKKFVEFGKASARVADQLNLLIETRGFKPEFVLIETPNSMPGEGVTSAFTFGKNCGVIEGIFHGMGVHVIHTVPAVWKVQMKLSSAKSQSIALARELFASVEVNPGLHIFDNPKKLADGRAEASILAWMAANKMGYLKTPENRSAS